MDKQTTSSNQPILWIDFIRSVSILLVIVIHSTGPLLNKWGEVISPTDWLVADVLVSFSRASVPLLFMISGYLLLGRQESIFSFYTKRFRKVLLPFVAWSIFYLVWQNGYRNYTLINMIKALIYEMLTKPASFHFWFLYALLAIYIFVPLIRRFVVSAEDIHLWYAAGVWLLFGPIQKMAEKTLGFGFAINLGFFTDYIGYFLIGYLLGKMNFSRNIVILAFVVYMGSGAYTVSATYFLSKQMGDYNGYYQWYLTLNAALMSFSAFIVLKKLGEAITSEFAGRWLRRFAGASFGIYLIHVFILITLKRFGFDAFSGPAIISAPALSLSVLLLSWVCVALMQKIPLLREAVPH